MKYKVSINDISEKAHSLIMFLKSLEKDNEFIEIEQEYYQEELSKDMVRELDYRYKLHKDNPEEGYSWEDIKKEIKSNEK